MNIVRSALTANNVAGLPNIRDYIHKGRDRLLEERRQRLLASAIMRDDHFNDSRISMGVQGGPAAMDEYDSPVEEIDEQDNVIQHGPQQQLAAIQQQPLEERRLRQHARGNRHANSYHETRRRG